MKQNLMLEPRQKVYLVDDDALARRVIPRELSDLGIEVKTFESAMAFLESYQAAFAGCILLDMCMPQMNGLELQKELQNRGVSLPIIFISGNAKVSDSVEALRSGAIDFVEKPFEPTKLQERISQAFAQDFQNKQSEIKKNRLHDQFAKLTQRENEILTILLNENEDTSSKQIARKLGISHRTVEQHRARIMEKTETRSLAELIAAAEVVGLRNQTLH